MISPSNLVSTGQYPLSYIPFGLILALLAWAFLYYTLLGVFFDLDQDDTWLCVALIFLINFAVSIAIPMLL